jgi:CO/xanthine dehydrogenase FAD-binding subunit
MVSYFFSYPSMNSLKPSDPCPIPGECHRGQIDWTASAATPSGPDEVIVAVELPAASQGLRAGYMKLRARDSMDFPDAGMAVALRTDTAGRITGLHLVANAVAAIPLLLDELGTAAAADLRSGPATLSALRRGDADRVGDPGRQGRGPHPAPPVTHRRR